MLPKLLTGYSCAKRAADKERMEEVKKQQANLLVARQTVVPLMVDVIREVYEGSMCAGSVSSLHQIWPRLAFYVSQQRTSRVVLLFPFLMKTRV